MTDGDAQTRRTPDSDSAGPKEVRVSTDSESAVRSNHTPSSSSDGLRSGESPPNTPPFPVPDHTLIRRIGKGAYGEVWLACSFIGLYRAVKFVRRAAFDSDRPYEREFDGIQRFEP